MKITSLKENGKIDEYDVILTYHSDKYNKHYAVYTKKQYNDKHELKIYISEYNYEVLENVVSEIKNTSEYKEVKQEIDKILLKIKEEAEKI